MSSFHPYIIVNSFKLQYIIWQITIFISCIFSTTMAPIGNISDVSNANGNIKAVMMNESSIKFFTYIITAHNLCPCVFPRPGFKGERRVLSSRGLHETEIDPSGFIETFVSLKSQKLVCIFSYCKK
jgi:hypothetical protein